ncbi:MAG: class E sortase [Micrococcales bacterium]|nr:class E sortase [Micrococcales bacterium]
MTVATHVRAPRATSARRAKYRALGAVGVSGELLITVGVLLIGFLVWQLWWTDLVTQNAQQQISQSLPWTQLPLAGGPAAGAGSSPAGADSGVKVAVPQYSDPPVTDEPKYTVPAKAFAAMWVPRFGATWQANITEGTDKPNVLNKGFVGHYENTAMPGGVGNFAIAGHRTTYSKPFNLIATLQVGDAVVIRTPHTWYVYTVTSTEIVYPNQVEVLAPVPDHPGQTPTARMITMTSCTPMYSARQRYVVHGVLKYWANADDGSIPAELLASTQAAGTTR